MGIKLWYMAHVAGKGSEENKWGLSSDEVAGR
jgi:hypothetical protein